jgi:UDP-N-acetylmuramate: L-alanyl-gamma-D-glutamyl-meso-diaminopimelate ligase
VILAPLGRASVPIGERLDLSQLAHDLGTKAEAAPSTEAIVERLATDVRPGDTVALLSNGAFEGLPSRLLDALASRALD